MPLTPAHRAGPAPGGAMKVLAFDTALAACSAAVWADGEVLARRRERLERGHAEALMPMVEAVRAQAGLAYDQLDRLAVTVGPGTFTGLRIGLAAARGLSLATGLPLAGVTTLEAVAAEAEQRLADAAPILAVLDARRGQVYAQAFGPGLVALSAPAVLAPEAAAELVPGAHAAVVGTGAKLVRARLAPASALHFPDLPQLPDAAVVAAIAAGEGRIADVGAPPVPLYLRPPDAKPRRPEGREGR